MRTKSITTTLACGFILWLCVTPLIASDRRDRQFWTVDAVECPITGAWKINIETEFHFDDHLNLLKRQADIGVSLKAKKWLSISVNYKRAEEKANADWEIENRPYINATIFWKMGRLSLSERARLEYRIQEQADPMWRYRNKIRVGLPFQDTSINLEPYLSDEIFVIFNKIAIEEHRILAGVAARLHNHIKVELYYMLKSENENYKWSDTTVMGVNILLAF